MSDLGLNIPFDRIKPYRRNRNCEKCLHGGASSQVMLVEKDNKETLDTIRKLDPVGYLEVSSNKIRFLMVRICPNCHYQWLELPRDESSKWCSASDIELMEKREDIQSLATLITYKLEAKMGIPGTTLDAYMKEILDAAAEIVLVVPREQSADELANKVAELAAIGFHFCNKYRQAQESQ